MPDRRIEDTAFAGEGIDSRRALIVGDFVKCGARYVKVHHVERTFQIGGWLLFKIHNVRGSPAVASVETGTPTDEQLAYRRVSQLEQNRKRGFRRHRGCQAMSRRVAPDARN